MTTNTLTIDNITYTVNKLSDKEWHIKIGKKIIRKIMQGDSGVSVMNKSCSGWEGFVYQGTMKQVAATFLSEYHASKMETKRIFTNMKQNNASTVSVAY